MRQAAKLSECLQEEISDLSEWQCRRIRASYVGVTTYVGERPELKCLSRGRKRNQNEIPSVTTSERGVVQTEMCTKGTLCGVVGTCKNTWRTIYKQRTGGIP